MNGTCTTDRLLDTAALHHYRTRSSGEQRGTTVTTAAPSEAASRPFEQVSAYNGRRYPQLPKLRVQAASLRVGRRGLLWSTTPAAWRTPVGVQRDIRARDRSAPSPLWLAVVG